MVFLFSFLLFLPLVASSALVTLSSGTFRGLTVNGTARWLGIPYAQPPRGSLRFEAPVPISRPVEGIQDALNFSRACPQPLPTARFSEDCLYLNVGVATTTNFIHDKASCPCLDPCADVLNLASYYRLIFSEGGAYNIGTASDPALDGTRIVTRSTAIGKPIIFVTINYRVNTFGFLASSHVPLGNLNIGLQDQRAALEFVQDNIAEFCGDREKVTVGGQSAGAGSVEAHILFPASRSLFRAAIMDSSTGPFKSSPPPSTYDEPGKPFDALLKATGCPADCTAVTCLKAVPSETLMNISNSFITSTLNHQLWEPTVAPGSFARVRASAKIALGDFAHVPMIAGTNLNEGTLFSTSLLGLGLSGSSEVTAFEQFVKASNIDESKVTQDVLDEIMHAYPANTEHLPFSTGDSLFDRAAAWYGDNMFLAPRRRFTAAAAKLQPVFTYFFTELMPGDSPELGVYHASELRLLFGPVPAPDVESEFANAMLDFYINFINDLNPGPSWPQYKPGTKLVLQLQRDNITSITDDFRQSYTDLLNTPEQLDEWEK